MNQVDVLLKLIGGKSSVQVLPGVFLGLDGERRAIVEFDGGQVPAYVVGGVPVAGERAWVQIVDGVAYLIGPFTPKPDEGTVITAASGVVNLSTSIGPVTAAYDDGLLLLDPHDIVHVVWGPSGAWVDGVKVDAAPPPPPVVPPTQIERRTVEFGATDSGSYQSGYGWRINDVWSSASNTGGWFYGTSIRDTIPDIAPIHSAQIFLPGPSRLTGARPFGRHDYESKPGGALTLHSTTTLPGTSGWVDIPTGLIDHLKANPGGLGFSYGGYNIWPGTQRDGQSGRLRITFGT